MSRLHTRSLQASGSDDLMVRVSVREGLEKIANDRSHGSTWLAHQGLNLLSSFARSSDVTSSEEYLRLLTFLVEKVSNLRPAMASIRNLSNFALRLLEGRYSCRADLSYLRTMTVRIAVTLGSRLKLATRGAALTATRNLRVSKTILVHSHSSTLESTFQMVKRRLNRVYITESRPLYEGRILAGKLARMGIKAVLITDASGPGFVGECDCVLVGADSVLADGSIVNKTGTLALALAAREFRVPFLAVADSSKVNAEAILHKGQFLEEMPGREVYTGKLDVQIRNPYFEVVPGNLVTSIFCELGAFKPGRIRSLARSSSRFWLTGIKRD